MRTKFQILGLLFLLNFTICLAASDEWFKIETNNFKIEFPKEPVSDNKIIKTDIGELKVTSIIYDASKSGSDDNLVYIISTTEYPDSIINSDSTAMIQDFFKNSIEGAINNIHGKKLTEEITEINGFPGREVRIDFQDGKAIIKMRAFLVKNTQYILQTITETKKDFNVSINKFMDSFILKK